jgi:hypothetical protein
MSSAPGEPVDLLDLKLLPAWLKESPDAKTYEHHEGDTGEERSPRRDGPGRQDRRGSGRDGASRRPRDREPRRPDARAGRPKGPRPANRPQAAQDGGARRFDDRDQAAEALAARVAVRFLPHPPVFDSVVAQIKSNPMAYSVFSLARLFLEKPERYDVHLAARPEAPLYQLGENGVVSSDQQFLESNAFRFAQANFYKVDITQSEPIKGNFSSVARCPASGTLLGPTNHHNYQPRLRSLYEQRFSRRMSFPDYQRQIEIVTDPAVVEKWKEEARTVTKFVTLKEETPATFNTAAEAERHFRQNYLPNLVRTVQEQVINGVTSRKLPDRTLARLVEDAWSRETRSPSQIMQELSNRFRGMSLQIFRHRRGMLFVSSVRSRPFVHEQASVSAHVQAILQAITTNPGINRKDFADKILVDVPAEETEARKLALAADLRWLVSEGYVIEFNDGSLDLPRVKVNAAGEKPSQTAEKTSDAAGKDASVSVPAPEPPGSVLAATTATISEAETKPTSDSQPGEETNANPSVSPSQGEDCSPAP